MAMQNNYLVQLGVTGVVVFVHGVVGGLVVGGDQHPSLGLRQVAVAAVEQVAVEEQRVSCNRTSDQQFGFLTFTVLRQETHSPDIVGALTPLVFIKGFLTTTSTECRGCPRIHTFSALRLAGTCECGSVRIRTAICIRDH